MNSVLPTQYLMTYLSYGRVYRNQKGNDFQRNVLMRAPLASWTDFVGPEKGTFLSTDTAQAGDNLELEPLRSLFFFVGTLANGYGARGRTPRRPPVRGCSQQNVYCISVKE